MSRTLPHFDHTHDLPPATMPNMAGGLGQPLPAGAFDEYDPLEPVAEGGMGMVYKARHKNLNRYEAIKIVKAGVLAGHREVARFRYEAEATAGLDHPNIVSVYRVGDAGGLPYFSMKWVDGGDLMTRVAELRADRRRLARIMAKVARAVHHAHTRGILHRDLKPANVLLDAADEPHVTDFGLAKSLSDADDGHRWSVTGVAVGTPGYIAPEQARGTKAVTTAVDVYGIGAILYELMTDRPPFVGTTLAEVMKAVIADPPTAPRALDPKADRDLEAIALKCLEKNPADRYPSAEAVAQDLEKVANGLPISVRPPGAREWLRDAYHRLPDTFKGYAWEVKLWFAVIMAVSQTAIYLLIRADAHVGWVWLVNMLSWAASAVAVQRHMIAKFTRLPETEKHSMMIAVGLIASQVGLAAAYLPVVGPARDCLAVYPAMAAVTGLALFVIGTTHWGQFFAIGLGVMLLTPVMTALNKSGSDLSPLLYGWAVSACMTYWAYAVKVKFAREAAAVVVTGGRGAVPMTKRELAGMGTVKTIGVAKAD